MQQFSELTFFHCSDCLNFLDWMLHSKSLYAWYQEFGILNDEVVMQIEMEQIEVEQTEVEPLMVQ